MRVPRAGTARAAAAKTARIITARTLAVWLCLIGVDGCGLFK